MAEIIEIDLELKVQTIEYKGKTYKVSVHAIEDEYCLCGCGRKSTNRSKYYNDACRKRVSRRKIEARKKAELENNNG